MLDDTERRRAELGPRVAARDTENCLENTVSIFEAVMKALLMRHLREKGDSQETINELLTKRIGSRFQNVEFAAEIVRNRMQYERFDGIDAKAIDRLKSTFEKRHPITHNLGVVDQKYLERAMREELEGREVVVTRQEIQEAIESCIKILSALHHKLFLKEATSPDGAL